MSETLAVGLRRSSDPAGQYTSPDGTLIYRLENGILTVTTPDGGTITISNFNRANNDLNIRLLDLAPDPATHFEWPALDPDRSLPTDQRAEPNWDGLRNGTAGSDYTGRAESIGPIFGTPGAEVIHGLASDDYLDGLGGADRLYGDAGNDTIYFFASDPVADALADGGTGRDVLIGYASGNNHFIGGPSDDPLDEGDLIASELGNDLLEGGNGADALFDYAGADILEGGPGDDYLFGHLAVGFVDPSVPNTWSITPVTEIIAGVQWTGTRYAFPAPDLAGLAFLDHEAPFDGKGDLLLGGAGNDYLSGSPGEDYLDAGGSEDTAADTNLLLGRDGNDCCSAAVAWATSYTVGRGRMNIGCDSQHNRCAP